MLPRQAGTVRRAVADLTAIVRAEGVLVVAGAAVIAVGLTLRVAIAWLDIETLVLKVLPDDAFYYFVTADRVSNGQNISFDGLTASNGYHPLWLFFLVPLYLLPGDSLPLHLALSMSSLLDVLAGVLIGIAVWRLTSHEVAGLFSMTLYLLLPQNVLSSVNGVESSLSAVLLAALFALVVWTWRERRGAWVGWAIFSGVLGGLAVLARLDSAVVVASLLALVALQQAGRTRWLAPAVSAGIVVLLVAPWLLWSQVAVGTAVPNSAETTTWHMRTYYSLANPEAGVLDKMQHGLANTKEVFLTQFPHLYLPDRPLDILIVAALAVLFAHLVLATRGSERREAGRRLVIAGLPLAAFVATLLFNSAYRWSVRSWYFAWGMPFVVAVAGLAFAHLQRLAGQGLARVPALRVHGEMTRSLLVYGVAVGALILAYLGPAQDIWRTGQFPVQGYNLRAAEYLKANTEEDERVASFNAGIIGYLSDRTVINIDGVVNGDALDALRERRLLDYLRSMDVSYVADSNSYLTWLPAFIRPDDWSSSLWGEDPDESLAIVESMGMAGPWQMSVWRLEE